MTVGHLDAFVVDLNLFVGFQVVPDQHLVLAADQRRPNFDRRQPVDVQVSDEVSREKHGNKRDVRVTVQVFSARGHNALRSLKNDVVHDRQIMGSKVPHHIDVVLEKAEIDARRIEII